eukprot:TRINITY_DN57193_c0_g1_i1.p1 TRINITY_DN57193_c0_g1~~TRINITY_DN57193_c0_g1_i1.p1  ORF type:complete len:588 (+),score=67.05 TRINITY_DN57193_c0_g1_i1:49-1764(+)
MGKGGDKGKPGKAKEEAKLAMVSKGQGGKSGGKDRGHGKGKRNDGKGKEKGGGGPPSSNEIPEVRRDELRRQVVEFVEGTETQLEMPPSVTGLERKYLHEVCQELNLTSQSFGKGGGRYLCIYRNVESHNADSQDQPAKHSFADFGAGIVSYSSVVLDAASKDQLLTLSKDSSVWKGWTVPDDWALHCDHMTICVGALQDPKTEDNRSIAADVHAKIASYRCAQEVDLKVVSIGFSDGVAAVGVIGCLSCNRNPHITIATAPQVAPSMSNSIAKWNMLPAEKQISLRGMVWMRGPARIEHPPAWIWSSAKASQDSSELTNFMSSTALTTSKSWLMKQRGGRPGSEANLRRQLLCRVLNKKVWVIHPGRLAQELAAKQILPDGTAEMLAERLQAPLVDPLNLFGCPTLLNGKFLERCVDFARARISHLTSGSSQLPWLSLLTSLACIRLVACVDIDVLLQRLSQSGFLEIQEDGSVKYLQLKDDCSDCNPAYSKPWRILRDFIWEFKTTSGSWQRFAESTQKHINQSLRKGSSELEYEAGGTKYIIDFEAMVLINSGTGDRSAVQRVSPPDN